MSDLISIQMAIEHWGRSSGNLTNDQIAELQREIESLPSVESRNKDAISREGLLRSWEELSPRGRTEFDQVIMTIPAIPSAEPEQRWIPCSERLPEAEDCPMDCLVTRKSKYIGNYTDMAVCEKNGMWTHEDWDAIVLGDVKDGKSTGLISTRDDDIIAWMPLPEAYKGGEQDE